ncbi:ketopantoate reductase family protein [Chloroflexota bacterium]
MKRMAVAGAGAIGSVLGGYISKAGKDITLVDPWLEHVEAMRQHGLRIDGTRGEHLVKVKALHTSEIQQLEGTLDILFIAVKSYETERILTLMKPCLKGDAWVISCQNGMNEDVIAGVVGASNTMGCVVVMGAALTGPGCVTQTGDRTVLFIGEIDGQITPRIQELAEIIGLCGKTEITTNLPGVRWSKLALNCMSNPLAPLTGYTVQQLHEDTRVRHIFELIAAELIQVAEAMGHKVEPISGISAELWKKSAQGELPEVRESLLRQGRHLGNRQLSLAQDLAKGRPTEIDYLNGYVVSRGKELYISTPVNEAMTRLITELENGRIQPSPANIDILWHSITHHKA